MFLKISAEGNRLAPGYSLPGSPLFALGTITTL
jgi:hypothetical protein